MTVAIFADCLTYHALFGDQVEGKEMKLARKAALNRKRNVPFPSHEILLLSSIKFSIIFSFLE